MGYLQDIRGGLKEYNLFSPYFELKLKPTKALSLRTGFRTLYLRFAEEFEFLDALAAILRAHREFMQRRLFEFDRTFTDNAVEFYINGETDQHGYFNALYRAIEEARGTIYITGWFLAPYIMLRRPAQDFPDSRLDLTLLRACQRGVHVA